MLALDSDREKLTGDASPEVVSPHIEEPTGAAMSSEGVLPAVAAGSATTGETASEQAFGGKPNAPTSEIIGGMYEPQEYQAACQAAGMPEKWDENYARGHTAAKQWTQPYEGRYDMAFALKPGYSASQAVKDFLAGPTIANFYVHEVAIEMNELRDELGDQQFDQMFGSADGQVDARISAAQRLKITPGMYTIPFAKQMLELAAENDAASKTEEPEAPAVAAGFIEAPQHASIAAPAPEMIGAELGVQREQELA